MRSVAGWTAGLLLTGLGIGSLMVSACGSSSSTVATAPALVPQTAEFNRPGVAGSFALDDPLSAAMAGTVRLDITSEDELPGQLDVGGVTFMALPVTLVPNVTSFVAQADDALLPLGPVNAITLDVSAAAVTVVKSDKASSPGTTSLIYQGDPNAVTFDDYVLIRALSALPPSLRNPGNIATVANELTGGPNFMPSDFDPVPDSTNTNFAAGGSFPGPDLLDAVVVYASTFLPQSLRTPDNIAATVNAVLTDAGLVTSDILSIPGNVLPGTIEFIGEANIASGVTFSGTTVGGLSGITYDSGSDVYYAIADDRTDSRFYTLTLDLSNGILSAGDATLTDVTLLSDTSGNPLDMPDPEGIALTSSASIFISSERDANGDPSVGEFSVTTGQQIDDLTVPNRFLPGNGQGVRDNLGFESLTLTPDSSLLFTATEGALVQDGERATLTESSPARILVYDAVTGQPGEEYVYDVDPIAEEPTPPDGFADSGLVDLLALNNTTLLALERSFSVGAPDRGYTIKLFEVDISGATDVSGVDDIDTLSGPLIPVEKTLLLDLETLGIVLDNVEGLTFGPDLPGGRRSLILVSDDNFSAFGPQATQFLAFSVDF